jgi:hypothetical protein
VDSSGNANSTAEWMVEVLDVKKPVALAGTDKVVDQHQEVTLSSKGSYDNVAIAVHKWTFTDTTGNVVLEGSQVSYVFREAGKYLVRLTVEDPSGNSATDTLEVTVNDITHPVARGGSDRTVDQNSTVFLDGSASTDNVAVTGWTWTFGTTAPTGSWRARTPSSTSPPRASTG